MKKYEHSERVMPFILDDKAKTLRDKVFVRHKEDRVTYEELSQGSNQIANFFIRKLGVIKEDKIAVILPNCVDFFYTQFGISKSGAVMVPINVLAKLDLLTHFLNNSDAQIVIVDEQFLPLLESIAEKIPNVKTLIVRTPEFNRNKFTFSREFNIIPYQELFNAPSTPPKPLVDWYDPVDIFYTSGTTGVSKGVVLSHNHHYTFGLAIAEYSRLGPKDIMYICLPLYHGMGSYMCIMPMLLCEGSIVLSDRFSASRWLSEIREYGATVTWAVYSMAPILMKQPERADDADNSLRIYLFSGMPPDIVEPFEKRFGVKVMEQYGATESADLAHSLWDERRRGAIGPINTAHYDIKIVNEHDEEVPGGEVGECVSRCKYPYMQMTEYYKMPGETVKAFRNLWLHSGDMCRIDKDGWIYFVGRGKDTIRRRGENISCYELESILSSHEGILECASIPVPSQLGEDEVKVVIAAKEGVRLEFSEIMKFCEEKMPKFMIPRYIELVTEIPKLPNEKVDKEGLKKDGLTSNTWDAEVGNYVKGSSDKR
jgi:crotonobetaine/carnitine-CoA ligase